MSLSILRWINNRAAAHKTLAIALTDVLGLGIGLWLHHLSQPPTQPPTVKQLIRALQKQDNLFHDAWQDIWTCLPDWVQKRWPGPLPQSAAQTRHSAALELVGFGPRAQPAVPFLVKALQDPDPQVGVAAVDALRELGPLAKSAVPALGDFFNDPARDVIMFQGMRAQIAGALAAIAPQDPQVQSALLDAAIRHRDPDFRATVIRALGRIKPPPRHVIQELTNSLQSTYAVVQQAAINALGDIGPDAAAAVPALIEAYENPPKAEPPAPPNVAWFLPPPPTPRFGLPLPNSPVAPNIPAPGVWARTALINVPKVNFSSRLAPSSSWFQDRANQASIIQTLGKIGPPAKAALPLLERESTNNFRFDSCHAIFARWQIDQNMEAAISSFLGRLREELPVQIRCTTIEYLLRLGPEAVPAISTALTHHDSPVRFAAIQALSQIGPPARSAVPQLTALAAIDQKYAIRAAAVAAVKAIQPVPDTKGQAPLQERAN
jgi:HEAT repeat protein